MSLDRDRLEMEKLAREWLELADRLDRRSER
jgi:hypothetical protein